MSHHYFEYEELTKKFIGKGLCQIEPITNQPIYPKNTTTIVPPNFDINKTPYFINNEWVLKDSSILRKQKISMVNIDGIPIYKIDKKTNELVEKSQVELSEEKDRISKEIEKINATKEINVLNNSIIKRVISANATKEEADLIKSYEAILKT